MKNLRFMLVTAFMLVCSVMSATEVTWQASGTSTLPTAIGEDIKLAWTPVAVSGLTVEQANSRIPFCQWHLDRDGSRRYGSSKCYI